MTVLVLSSDLLRTVCNDSETVPPDTRIPNVDRSLDAVSFCLGAAYLLQVVVYFALAVRHRAVVLVWSDKTHIFLSQLSGAANLSIFYLSGGGIHLAADQFKKGVQLVSFGLALTLSFLSALMWVDLKRKIIISTLRFKELKHVSSSWMLRAAVLVPGLVGLVYCLVIALTVKCVPFVSLYRRFCGFMLGITIMLFLVNFHYMRKTLNAMTRLKESKHSAGCAASTKDAIRQIRMVSGFIALNVPPFAGYLATIVATTYLEDSPGLYIVVLVYHGVVLLLYSQLIFKVFYHLRMKKHRAVKPRNTFSSKQR